MAVAHRGRVVASVSAQAHYGGYDFNFTKSVPERLRCSICTKVLRDPHLTECCGQHFCESCLKYWFKKQKKTSCPHCRHDNFNHMLNKERKRDIEELEIQCTKQQVGCQWLGELRSLQDHLESDEGCGYVKVQCSNKCGVKMIRKELEAHLAQQCPLRKIKCQYCYYEDTCQTITTQHYDECPSYPLPCPNNCGTTDILRRDMANHHSRCELEPVECPFHEAGCTVQIVRREFDAHMSENQQHHLLVLLGAFQETKRELGESQRKLDNTTVRLLETRLELEEIKGKPAEKKTLKKHGDEVTFHMTNFSLHKQTGKVWHSPPFYFDKGYKLCLGVYANGKGTGAGTHVSVELLQMRGEHDKLGWEEQFYGKRKLIRFHNVGEYIIIQMMMQCKKPMLQEKQFTLKHHLCSSCFECLPPHEDLCVCQSTKRECGNTPISEDKFIDHKSAEELMVLNDTIVLKISCAHYEVVVWEADT